MNEVPKAIEHNITFISCPEEKSEEETEVLASEYEGEVVGSEDDGEDVKFGVDSKEDRVLGSIAHLFETEESTVARVQELVLLIIWNFLWCLLFQQLQLFLFTLKIYYNQYTSIKVFNRGEFRAFKQF